VAEYNIVLQCSKMSPQIYM